MTVPVTEAAGTRELQRPMERVVVTFLDSTKSRDLILHSALRLLEGASGVLGAVAPAKAAPEGDLKTLHTKIGELTLENDFLSGALGKAGLLPSTKRRSTATMG